MRKCLKRIALCFFLAALVWCGTLAADRERLNKEFIRLHVVANSNNEEDQILKLQVRDVVMESIHQDLMNLTNVEAAKAYLEKNLPQIQQAAQTALRMAGCDREVVVSLCREAFDTHTSESFSLPAGVYDALRITIGEGQGKNWWCVVFPFLSFSSADEWEDIAADAGFPNRLGYASGEDWGYEIRFYLLDIMGRLENIFFQG